MAENEKNRPLIEPMIFDNPDNVTQNNKGLQKGMDFDVRTKSFEEKIYIILYRLEGDNLEEYQKNCFSLCIGRTNAYSDIKEKLISGLDIDIHRSKIITETKQTETATGDTKYYMLPYDECISVYAFCISVADYYSDDDFNIEEYNNSEIPEADDITKLPGYLSPEQLEYRKMLEASFNRDKFLNDLKNSNNSGVNI